MLSVQAADFRARLESSIVKAKGCALWFQIGTKAI